MLNYAGEAGDSRCQLTIVSCLAGRPRVAIWMRVGGAGGSTLAFEAGDRADDN